MPDKKADWVEFDSGRICSECGKPIMRRRLTDAGFMTGFESDIVCPCVIAKQKTEQAYNIQKGISFIHTDMVNNCGLLKRWQGCTLESFICKPGQEDALTAAREFVDGFNNTGSKTTGIIFCGATGSGKTHLAAAIAYNIILSYPVNNEIAERAGANGYCHEHYSPVRFTNTVNLLGQIKATYTGHSEDSAQEIISEYQRARLIILDDFGAEKPSEWVTERFFEIIDYRYSAVLPMIITTNSLPEEIKARLGARIYDRIREMCRFISITASTQRITAK